MPKDRDRFFAGLDNRPPPDDLESLRGWAARISHYLETHDRINQYAWMVYRPDILADKGLIGLSADYPEPIRQLRESVHNADRFLDELDKDDNDETQAQLYDMMHVLMMRIEWVVGIIEQRKDSTVSQIPGGKQPERAKRPGRKKADYEAEQRESQRAAEWVRARDTGVYKAAFAKQIGMTLKELGRLLTRVRARKRRSDK